MNSDPLTRERDARIAAYTAALEARAAHPGDRRLEACFAAALHALNFWGDPIPRAAETNSAAPEVSADESTEAIAARILASDRIPGEGRRSAHVEAVAARIAAA